MAANSTAISAGDTTKLRLASADARLPAHQAGDLADPDAGRGIRAEHQTGNGDEDRQQGCQRYHRVVGNPGAAAEAAILNPDRVSAGPAG